MINFERLFRQSPFLVFPRRFSIKFNDTISRRRLNLLLYNSATLDNLEVIVQLMQSSDKRTIFFFE